MTVKIPVDEGLLQEARKRGKHASAEETVREALEAYIKMQKVSEFFDMAAETEWGVEPEKKA